MSSFSEIPPGAAGRLIRHYQMELIPHEGAWFSLRWVSAERVSGRPAGSAIVALVEGAHFSAMHRLRTDETWHFHGGEPAELLLLHPGGRTERVRLGGDVFGGERPQVTVPAGVWMGARPAREHAEAYSFFGCTLAPGFDPADYEPGYRDELQAGWPAEAELIAALTRADSLTRPKTLASVATNGSATATAAAGSAALAASRVFGPGDAVEIAVAPGVTLRELAGRTAGARTEAVSVARFRLEAGASTGSSRYHGCDEFFVVLSGTGMAMLNDTQTAVRPGSVVAIARGDPHELRADPGGTLEFLAVLAPAFEPTHYAPECG